MPAAPRSVLTILAVADVEASARFYSAAFGWPRLVEAPVYVELAQPGGQRLGLYQREAYARNPGQPAAAIPPGEVGPVEVYLHAPDLEGAIAAALAAGARVLSARSLRDWGDEACYLADPDGHLIVLARPVIPASRRDFSLDLGGFHLRHLRDEDAPALARRADDPGIAANLRDAFPSPYTEADARGFLAMVAVQEPPFAIGIATPEDEVVGCIGWSAHADVERFSAEVGYWLARPFWGQGIVTRALRAVTELAFEKHGLHRLYAVPFETNPASHRVLEKAGYVLEGKLRASTFKAGRFVDQRLYARVS